MKSIQHPVVQNIEDNLSYLNDTLAVDKSFDVIRLDVVYASRKMALFLVDGFAKDDILHYLMKILLDLKKEDLEPDPLEKLLKTYI